MSRLLFIGDIVGPAGLAYVERTLPVLAAELEPTFIVANAENLALTGTQTHGGCGMTPDLLERLFAAGVDLVTGGNHSWDGPSGHLVHADPRVLRPLNYGAAAPGRGAAVLEKGSVRLGVINAISRTASPLADQPLDAIDGQLERWSEVDAVLLDFHGESVMEKLTVAYALAGKVTAVLGTHTHVQTTDLRLLPGNTAYVSDVGMTGPGGGVQGYAPEPLVEMLKTRLPGNTSISFATGDVELGAVIVDFDGQSAASIKRL